MKIATFNNGHKEIRKNYTRDYKFAYKAVSTQGAVEYGFSTTRKSAEANARNFIGLELKLANEMYRFNLSPVRKGLKELTKQLINEIEIVECETL